MALHKANMSESSEDPLAGLGGEVASKRTQGLNRSTIMMGLMFLVGAGWLGWEYKQNKAYAPTNQEKQNQVMVEAGLMTMQQVAAPKANDSQATRVTEAFVYDASQRQVASADLKMNPFIYVARQVKQPDVVDTNKTPEVISHPVDDEKAPPLPQMELGLIMNFGDKWEAFISGKRYSDGDTIGVWTIYKIEKDRVILRSKTKTKIWEHRLTKGAGKKDTK